MSRGQTTLDFAIGVSVFLLTVAFVFAFVPGMVQPFSDSGQEEMASSNRIADRLATDALAGEDPHVLDAACAASFFDEDPSPPARCAFEGGTVEEVLALDFRTDVHVAIRSNVDDEEPLCWNSDDRTVVASNNDDGTPNGDCNIEFETDDEPSDWDAAVTATRHVSVGGTDATLVVNVW